MNKKEIDSAINKEIDIDSAINIVILYDKFNDMEQEVSWVWEE